MAKLFNRAKMDTSTTGSGTITLGSAVDGYQSFADAGVADSDVVQYVIEDGNNWEIGTGTYSATGTSLTRTPSESSNSGSAISLTGAAEVFISAIHSDFERLQNAGTTKVEATSTGATVTGDIAVTGTVDGVDIAARDAVLTSTTTTADAALPKAGGTVTGSTTFSHSSGITIGEADIFHQTANTWRGITVKNNGDSNEVTIDGQSSDGTQRLSIYGASSAQGFLNPTNNSWKLQIPNSGSFLRDATYTIWDSGNDGSGSGLDADTVDGLHASSFMRTENNIGLSRALGWYPAYGSATESNVFWSDAEEAVALYSSSDTSIGMASKATRVTVGQKYRFTVPIKSSAADSDGLYVRIYYYTGDLPDGKFAVSNSALHPNVQEDTGGDTGWYENSSHTTSWRNFERTWTAPSTGYVSVVILNWSGFTGTVYAKQPDISLQEYSNLYVDGSIYHNGDTDTYLNFGTNTITLATGGSSEITVNTTGVRLGDTGNGYFQPVSGNYGSIQIDGGAHGSYEGYSIGGRAVFMHNNNTVTGIYNDVNNEWLFYGVHNSYTRMYHNGSSKVQTTSSGVQVNGDLNSTSDIRYKKNIETIDGALEKVQALRGVTFDWDNDAFPEGEDTKKPNFTERATGVIAQDVEKVLPEAVRENQETGFKNVAYGNMVGLLIEAIKEQQTQIDALTAQVEELKRQ